MLAIFVFFVIYCSVCVFADLYMFVFDSFVFCCVWYYLTMANHVSYWVIRMDTFFVSKFLVFSASFSVYIIMFSLFNIKNESINSRKRYERFFGSERHWYYVTIQLITLHDTWTDTQALTCRFCFSCCCCCCCCCCCLSKILFCWKALRLAEKKGRGP